MKIKKFNESNESNWNKPTDKILKGTINFEVDTGSIENTGAYQREMDSTGDISAARQYGIEEWIYTHGVDMKFKLYDGLGNIIENEKEFDEKIENAEKFNL